MNNYFESQLIKELKELNCEHVKAILKKYKDKEEQIKELEIQSEAIQEQIKSLYHE